MTPRLLRILGVLITLLLIVYIFDIPRDLFGFLLYPSAHSALHLALMLIVVFLSVRVTGNSPGDKVPWYDLLFILAGLAGCLYIFVKTPEIHRMHKILSHPHEQVLGWLTLIVVAEAVRRTVGLSMVIMPILFIFYAKIAHLLPGLLGGLSYSWSRIWTYMYLYETGIFGIVLELGATIILSFILFGAFLQEAGAGKFFTDLGLLLVGRMRGGAAKVTLITTGLLGMITGSPLANAGAIGPMTIPLMAKSGYKPEYSAGVLALGATGATLVPPVMGAVAFIMAHYSSNTYGRICLAAILPSILYYGSIYFQIDFKVLREKTGSAFSRHEIPSFRQVMSYGWLYLIPLGVLVYLLLVMDYEPTRSALYATASLVAVSFFNKEMRFTPKKILSAIENTAKGMVAISPTCAIVGIITGSVTVTGLGVNLSMLITDLAAGNLLILALLTWAAGYIAGMGVAVILTYILMALLIAPAMVQAGPPPLVVHMFIFYSIMSMFFTPPLCPAVWVAAGLANAKNWPSAVVAMRMGIAAYIIPFAILYKPALVLIGTPLEIALATVTSLGGAFFISSSVEGYLLEKTALWERIILLVSGMSLFHPDLRLNLIGFLAGLILTALNRKLAGPGRCLCNR